MKWAQGRRPSAPLDRQAGFNSVSKLFGQGLTDPDRRVAFPAAFVNLPRDVQIIYTYNFSQSSSFFGVPAPSLSPGQPAGDRFCPPGPRPTMFLGHPTSTRAYRHNFTY